MFSRLMQTVSIIALALGSPSAFAQEAATCAEGETQVETDGALSCVPSTDETATDEGPVEEATSSDAEAEVPAEETPDTAVPAETAEDAPAETDTGDAATGDTTADTSAEQAPAADSAETSTEEVPTDEVPTDDTAEVPVEEDVPAEGTAEVPLAETPADEAAEAPVDEEPAEDAAETAPVEETVETPVEDEAVPETVEAPTEEAPTAEGADTPAEEAPSSDVTETQTEDGPADGTSEVVETPAEDASSDSATASTEDTEVVQDDTADTAAAANTTVETEAAEAPVAAEAGAEAEVETVTEDSARSSDQEFTQAEAVASDDDGLSKLEKFTLGALGVAAVATLLNKDDDVVVAADDRIVVRDGQGAYRVLKNDDELLRRPGVRVATEEFDDGSTRTIVNREDGSRVVTIRSATGQTLMRTRILPDGREVSLFDDTQQVQPVDVATLPQVEVRPALRASDGTDLRAALAALGNPTDRTYSLQQIRQIRAVRNLVPEIDVEAVNFESGSAVIQAEEAQDLAQIGELIADEIAVDPGAVFLIEGHTDAVGGAAMNLALSDRRAESTALALTEYFAIPPENLVVQGYGEANLKIRTNAAERINRRVAIRKITPLLRAQ